MTLEKADDLVLPCAGKLRFNTKPEAQAAATVAHHQHGIILKPYACRYCAWWHLSSRSND